MATQQKKCPPTQAALLRTPVRIDTQVKTPDDRGGYALDWTAYYSARAQRIDLSGSETLRAAQMTNTQMKRYKMRWPPSITLDASMRLVDLTTSLIYNIRDVNGPDQEGRWVTLLCEQIPSSTGA
jgi:head-tail adaptor